MRRSARVQARLAKSEVITKQAARKRVRAAMETPAHDETAIARQKTAVVDVEEAISNPTIARHIRTIELMRKNGDAPVDTMGCHMLADKNSDPKVYRFQILVALMLSSQTKDAVTAAAMERLKKRGCTIDQIIEMPMEDLKALLNPVGFYNRKADYLKKAAAILKKSYESDVPNTMPALCSLPGVGLKMANLALQICYNQTEGIGVDTHVHRISNRLEWVSTKTPEQTEAKLQELLPRSRWSTINKLLAGFGQTMCLPVRPKCSECLLRESCPWLKKQGGL